MSPKKSYTTADIDSPEGLDHVRLRPTTHLGEDPLNTAMREIIDNAFDEVSGGHADTVKFIIHGDNDFEVIDNGRGLPVDWSEKKGVNGIVLTIGTKESGQNFSHGSDDVVGLSGTNGVGASAVTAISSRLDATSTRGGKSYSQSFKDGKPGKFDGTKFDPQATFSEKPGEKLKGKKSSLHDGTSIRWSFDMELMDGYDINLSSVIERARFSAMLSGGATLIIIDSEGNEEKVTSSPDNGTQDILKDVTGESSAADLSLSGEGEFNIRKNVTRKFSWEISARVNHSGDGKSWGFVNGIYNIDGGTHVNSSSAAISKSLMAKIPTMRNIKKKKDDEFIEQDFVSTMDIVVSIRGADIPMKGQEKAAVTSKPLGNSLRTLLGESMDKWVAVKKNNSILTEWGKAALELSREKKYAEAAKKRARSQQEKKRFGRQVTMPAKLVDCKNSGPGNYAEIFIVEGDSAGGTVKAARDANYQAVYPIKGKILNVIKSAMSKSDKNPEVTGIIDSAGTGILNECDPTKSNYDKYIIAADADSDGHHIEMLLISLFYKMMPGLLTQGHVYIAQSPLYAIRDEKNGVTEYAYNAKELEEKKKEVFGRRQIPPHSIERFKGLGQMDAVDFENTVMSAENRRLKMVSVHDADIAVEYARNAEEHEETVDPMEEIKDMMMNLMGENPEFRKKVLESHGISAQFEYE